MQTLRALMLGDVVGEPGLQALERHLPRIMQERSLHFVVANGENAAGGFGITEPYLQRIFAAGVDVVTGGNHTWEKREFWTTLDTDERALRPLNYPPGNPGKGYVQVEKPAPWNGAPLTWTVLNLQGREYMPSIDCPFQAFDSLYPQLNQSSITLLDFHAESSREKEAFARYLDGRVQVIAGTHTHVQTADERLLPKGTAYISDLGMCGLLDGVIGMDTKICLDRTRNQVLYRMEVATPANNETAELQGIIVAFDGATRKALSIERLHTDTL